MPGFTTTWRQTRGCHQPKNVKPSRVLGRVKPFYVDSELPADTGRDHYLAISDAFGYAQVLSHLLHQGHIVHSAPSQVEVQFQSSSSNHIADELSRRPDTPSDGTHESMPELE